MSGARYQLLSLTAAALGVALGLGLGAGPIAQDTEADHRRTTDQLTGHVERLTKHVGRLESARAADARVVAALAAPLTADRLSERSVVVVATPGADQKLVRRVGTVLEASGATVTGVLRLTKVYVDPAQAQSPLEDLSLRLVPPGVQFADGATAIERVGTVLARSTLRKPADPPSTAAASTDDAAAADAIDDDAAGVIAGLDELGAVKLDGKPGDLADLAVVVSGPSDRADAEPALAGLVKALDAGGLGAVLAGPGAARAGALRWVRDDTAGDPEGGISTVDSLDAPVGQAALVLALAEQAAGKAGHYGLGRGARDVLPAVAPKG